MEKKVYLGYKPKPTNITKLKNYISNSGSESIPSPKPMKLNKK